MRLKIEVRERDKVKKRKWRIIEEPNWTIFQCMARGCDGCSCCEHPRYGLKALQRAILEDAEKPGGRS